MRILSFDADSQGIHLCLLEDGVVVAEKIIVSANPNRQELATNLLPAVASTLAEIQWNKASLGIVVVGCGPGSFTGIRGAVTVARMLAYALKLPLIGLSRFEVIASSFEGSVAVVLSAYRDFCYMSALEVASGGQTRFLINPQCVALSELAQALNLAKQDTKVGCFVANPGVQLTTGISFKPMPVIDNLASRQAKIAWNRLSLKTGNPSDVVADDFPWKLVEPLYLREPSVTLKKS